MGNALAIDGGQPVLGRPLTPAKGISLLGEEERAAALDVLASRSLFRYYGPDLLRKVEAFEAEATRLFGCRYAVATSSGTAALRSALAAVGVGCGDEVIVPAFTFVATVNAVVTMGAVPVFAEIDETCGMDPSDLAAKLTERTAAVMPVHLENLACDMDAILPVVRAHGAAVIEDAAQAMGVTYRGRSVGTMGDMGAFSLQLEKNVTAGEGGLVTSDDERLYLRAARYQDQGGQFVTSTGSERGSDSIEPFVGENLRMTEIAGAIAHVQLGKLPRLLGGQRANHSQILELIGSPPGIEFRRRPDPEGDGCSSIGMFLPSRDEARRFARSLIAEGVPAGLMYRGQPVYATDSILNKRTASGKGGPWNCSEHPCHVDYRMGMCPTTEDLASRFVVALVGAGYSSQDCEAVAEAVLKVSTAMFGA
ncbi:MAG TPA: DegT/DnrJ/EryC1/StrS family aminotransferase [Acidimicrobiales bacterium]|nr:DegT/DnrJ/EryC1/StrS family aminotransferase [Acidimicrobiales bacterium]